MSSCRATNADRAAWLNDKGAGVRMERENAFEALAAALSPDVALALVARVRELEAQVESTMQERAAAAAEARAAVIDELRRELEVAPGCYYGDCDVAKRTVEVLDRLRGRDGER